MDNNAVQKGTDFSSTQKWLENYNQDSAISDSYAQTSATILIARDVKTTVLIPATDQAENFAQETVIALYDKVVPGGIGSVEPNWKAIFHQYATVQDALKDNLIPGGQCRNRFANA